LIKIFNNKLSRINFLILLGILTYLFIEVSYDSQVSGIKKATPSVVNIHTGVSAMAKSSGYLKESMTAGSGIILSRDGYIITNLHLIANQQNIRVELDGGQFFSATLVGADARSDLAVIKIDVANDLVPMQIANSASIEIGDEVIAIGNAFALGKTFTSGIVSATGRDYGNPYLELIQTDAAINPGNSGGALINKQGNLIGMNTKIYSQTGSYAGIGFALPAKKLIDLSSEIIKYGSVKRSWIGDFRVKPVRLYINQQLTLGLEIMELKNFGPIVNQGQISTGAIIISINDGEGTWKRLTEVLGSSFPGDEIALQVLEGQSVRSLKLVTEAS